MTLLQPKFTSVKIASFAALAVLATTQRASAQGVFLQQSNDVVAIQMESATPPGGWNLSTATPGYTGDGYFEWTGPNYFFNSGNGLFGFDFEISTSGQHKVSIYNRHEDPDPTEENDTWIRIDGGTWQKAFSNMPSSVGNWTWETRLSPGGGQLTYTLSPGLHRVEFSGRSNGFKMDRVHIYPSSVGGTSTNIPESPQRFGTSYCTTVANSTGVVSTLEAIGSPIASRNDLTLHGMDLPVNSVGYFAVARTQFFFPNPGGSTGNVCLGANIGRYLGTVLTTDSAGRISMPVNLAAVPQPTGSQPTLAGETWNFQYWHRDVNSGGGTTSNFSRGLEINFE